MTRYTKADLDNLADMMARDRAHELKAISFEPAWVLMVTDSGLATLQVTFQAGVAGQLRNFTMNRAL